LRFDIKHAIDKVYANVARLDDEHFHSDIAYLNGLADYIIESTNLRPQYPCGATIYEQLVANLSPAAHRAIFGGWTA
jgi:hypothetical protein